VAARIDGAERAAAHGPPERPVWGDAGLRLAPPAEGAEAPPSPRLEGLLDYLEHLQREPEGAPPARLRAPPASPN
jgi:hypothetical protein